MEVNSFARFFLRLNPFWSGLVNMYNLRRLYWPWLGWCVGVDEFTHWPHWVGLQNMMRRLCLIIVPVSPHVPASRYTCKLANTNTGVTGGTPQLGKQFSKYKSNMKIDFWKQLDPVSSAVGSPTNGRTDKVAN